ncbi:hypothetical protein [Roseisolibacter agri]|uniref:PorV/PorQ family protein n=1 Tax=Roseisolibacter agri TaxID=2014610 RepID=A0AA37V1M4_9BACT|nr:hypothetical protein [Roseisolibacter agri]GLC24012.1 hypothetical protein rosag_05250 [Roseisolibacter agri]
MPAHLSPRHAAAVAALALVASAAAAQDTGAPLVLRLPVSTRALAMGGGQPVAVDAESQLYNPALLAWSRGASAQGQRWGAASTMGVLASTLSALRGTTGLAVQYLDYGATAGGLPDATRDATGALPTRGPVTASSLAASIGYARPMLGVRAGAVLRYAEERLGAARDGTVSADVGLAKGFLFDNVVVGLAVQHLGAGLQLAGARAPLPTRVTLGLSGAGYPLNPWLDVGASAAVSVLRGGEVAVAGGGELSLVPLQGYAITARVGARRTLAPGERPVTAGFGLTRDRVSLDYAYEPFVARDAHRIGLRVR